MQGGDAKGGADKSSQLIIKDSRESRVKMLLFAMVACICNPQRSWLHGSPASLIGE